MPLSRDQAAQLRHTIATAREGRATLSQLAAAHDLAAGAGLSGCAGELREHIRREVSPPEPRSAGRDVVLGISTGMLTHYLLRGL